MRQARPEADVLCLAPSLEAPSGHPAIWSKLLSHYLHEVIHQSIERIYADVPDQPLPVNIFAGCGFQPYCRQTVWRLHTPPDLDLSVPGSLAIRPQRSDDAFGLLQLYTATVPKRVREAEGMLAGDDSLPPILENWPGKQNVMYVLAKAHCVVGAVQLTAGRQGTALRLWADTLQPDSRPIEELLHFALAAVKADRWPLPVFIAVSDYHGGMNAILSELGFAPFSDRVKMVKHVVKWVRESIAAPLPKIETAGEVVPSPFASPDAAKSSAHSSFTDSGHAL
ncbi:MAG: hypothetical protein H3C34_00995 [Caldilineaceae bacterium]|nr:hypothetical protein [Caldilineaceae bacterium]